MKIYSISRIKNEEDIIESFIRYHLNFIDGMVIIEDYSSDETYNILQKLKNENLPVHIYRNSKKPIPQQEVINNAYNIALNDFDADLVVPLDGDEFLVCKEGGNPRDVLEKLPKDRYFQVHWRTYLPNLEENSFSIDNLKIIRDPIADDRSKIIIPSELTEKYDVRITAGSHSVENKDIPFEKLDELRIAHIPIRNKMQCISKEVVGWLNNISNYYKDPKASWHQNIMYKMLVDSNGNLTDDQIISYAKSYSSRKSLEDTIEEFEHPFDTSFCKNMDLRYTNEYNEMGWAKILEFAENMALNYGKTNQILKDMNEDIVGKSNDKSDYLYNLENSYAYVKKQLYFKENNHVIRSKNYIGKIELKNDQIANLKNKISDKNNNIADLKHTVSSKNDRIVELKDIVSSKNDRIVELKDIVSSKNDRIVELKDVVSSKNDRIVELKDVVSSKNDRIVELKDIVSSKNDRIDDLKGKISAKNDRIVELKDIASRRSENINRLIQENEKLKNENKKLNKINNDIFNSNSWKITKPLRKL